MSIITGFSVNLEIPHKVIGNGGPKAYVITEKMLAAGSSLSVALAIKRAGGKAKCLGTVGKDRFAEMLAEEVAKTGVSVAMLPIRERTAKTDTYHYGGGRESQLFCDKPGYNGCRPKALRSELALLVGEAGARAFVFSGVLSKDIPLVKLTLEILDGQEIEKVMMPSEEVVWHPDFDKIARRCGLLIMNEREFKKLIHRDEGLEVDERHLKTLARLVPEAIVTCGSKGAYYVSGKEIIFQPAFPVENVVDTVGAGDCFAGWFLACREKGPEIGMRYAAAAAALKIQRVGGPKSPHLKEVKKFLKERAVASP